MVSFLPKGSKVVGDEYIRDLTDDLSTMSDEQKRLSGVFADVLRMCFGGLLCKRQVDRVQAVEIQHGSSEDGPIAEIQTHPFFIATNDHDDKTVLIHFSICRIRKESDPEDTSLSCTLVFCVQDDSGNIDNDTMHIDDISDDLFDTLVGATDKHPNSHKGYAIVGEWMADRIEGNLKRYWG